MAAKEVVFGDAARAKMVEGVNIHPNKPLDGFTLSNVSGTCGKGISLRNIRRASLKGIRVTGYEGPLISVNNVTGSGLDGAAPLPATTFAPPIPSPETPYVLK